MVPDDEFVAVVARANGFRTDVGDLGMTGDEISANVRARLYWNPKVPQLAAGHEALANEIYALLHNASLSSSQAGCLRTSSTDQRLPRFATA